jgi:hypothetical protein
MPMVAVGTKTISVSALLSLSRYSAPLKAGKSIGQF